MSDLIKREDAINSIYKLKKTVIKQDVLAYCDGIFDALEIVQDLPSADISQGEWIPCGERLPEEREWIGTKKFGTTISDEVLVTFESRGERFVRPIHFQNGELGGMDKHTMDAVHGEWKAVAWMPLPEPWKGADDE